MLNTPIFVNYKLYQSLVDVAKWALVVDCLDELFTNSGGISWEEVKGINSKCFHGDFVSLMRSLSNLGMSRMENWTVYKAYSPLGWLIVLRIFIFCCIEVDERCRAVLCFFILVVVISFWMDHLREGTCSIPRCVWIITRYKK